MRELKIRLYAADVRALCDRQIYERALSLLDDDRRERTERIRNEAGQRLSAGAGLLLKTALSRSGAENVKIIRGDNGKPYVEGRDDLFFNLSHSGDMVICAVAPCEVGCDVEHRRPAVSRIASRYFTPEEQAFVSLDPDNFFRMWTLKESFLKVTGKGLALGLTDFSINVSDTEISVSQNVDGRAYSFKEYFSFDGYCCSVCAADMGSCSFEEHIISCDIENLIDQ